MTDITAAPTNDNEESKNLNSDSLRIQLRNLHRYVTNKEIKKLLLKSGCLDGSRKISILKEHAFVSFTNEAQLERALVALNGQKLKGNIVVAKRASADSYRKTDRSQQSTNKADAPEVSLLDLVTPLWNMTYEKQLETKQALIDEQLKSLDRQIKSMGVGSVDVTKVATPIRASPTYRNYRNKCEFTVGKTKTDEISVGFVVGKFGSVVESPRECTHLPQFMLNCVADFEMFVKNSNVPIYEESTKNGIV